MLEKYFKSDVIEGATELLPIYGQVAFRIAEALRTEESDVKRALELYREVVVVDPRWGTVMKSYMQAMNEERKRRELAAKEEMKQLEASVLAEVHKLVVEAKYSEALEILSQMKKMKPNDLGLAESSHRVSLAMLENA